MAQIQTADGRGAPQSNMTLHNEYTVFNAGADVQRQRQDAYDGQYAEVAFKGTQQALCLPAGGELHHPDGNITPVAPYDWVVELPDGTMGSISAEQVADHMELVSGSDEQKQAYEQTVALVANSRIQPGPNVQLADEDAPRMPHPDGYEAAEREMTRRDFESIQATAVRQAEDARTQLTVIARTAEQRNIITPTEAADWIDTGVAPDGVAVHFEAGLGSYEVVRPAQPTAASIPGGAEAILEPADEPDTVEPSET